MALQNSDLFYVQRGANGFKMQASLLNDYIAANSGSLNYRGTVDCTLAVGTQLENNPPLVGDIYINTGDGTVNTSGTNNTNSWVGITGQTIANGQRIVYDGNTWEIVGQEAGGGLESIVAGEGIAVDNTDDANPVVSATKATQSAYGITQLAQDPPNAGDLTSTEVTDVLHVAHFNELSGRITTAAGGGVQSITGTDPIETTVSTDGHDVTVSIKDATTAQKGAVQLDSSVSVTDETQAVTGKGVAGYAVPLNLTGLPSLS